MPTYTHDYQSVSDESVQVEIDYTGGTDKNYAATRLPIGDLVKVTQSGVNITSSASIEDLGGSIGEVVTFGSPSTLSGLVLVTYIESVNGVTITDEAIRITRYADGGTPNNYFEVKNFPIKASSVSLADGNGVDKSSFISSISGNGRERVYVGSLAEGKYVAGYQYDNGEVGSLYQDYKDYKEDETSLTAFVSETTTSYQDRLTETSNELETSKKVFRLWLMRLIYKLYPVLTTDENTLTDTARTFWQSNSTNFMGSTDYGTLHTNITAVATQMETNGNPAVYSNPGDNTASKIQTYLAELAEIDNQEGTIAISAGTRYDIDGVSNSSALSSTDRGKFTDDDTDASGSYSHTADYSLKLVLDAKYYVTGMEVTVIPDDDTTLDLDTISAHLSSDNTITPSNFNDGSDTSKQVSNGSYKGILDIESNKHPYFTFINEVMKDSNGAPITKDSDNQPFSHRILMKRDTIVLFKTSNKSSNYIAEIKLFVPITGISTLLDYLGLDESINDRLRIYNKTQAFIDAYNDEESVINAWRPETTTGVTTSGIVASSGSIYDADSADSSPVPGDKQVAWGYVKTAIDAIIDSEFDFTTTIDISSVLTAWATELTTEGISNDDKIIRNNYTVWKKKYEEAAIKYKSAVNDKNRKQVDLIETKQLIDVYEPLPSVT